MDHVLENRLLEAFPEVKSSFSSECVGVCGRRKGGACLLLSKEHAHARTHTHTR